MCEQATPPSFVSICSMLIVYRITLSGLPHALMNNTLGHGHIHVHVSSELLNFVLALGFVCFS